MMIKNYKFDVMYKNELVSEVIVRNSTVEITKHNRNIAIQPFYGGPINVERIESFLKSRCFDPARSDKKNLLKNMNLENYSSYAIVKKTHGHMFHDCLWIKFPGEELKWEDIKNGTC